jgi:hypothetical protein
MIIREEQMQAFRRSAVYQFDCEMVEHLQTYAPDLSQVLGEEGVRRVIQLGRERGSKYGFTNRGPVRLYIELMFSLGSDFDSDPQLPWAGELLQQGGRGRDQMTDAQELYSAAVGYFDEVMGPHDWYAIEALERYDRLTPERFRRLPGGFEERIMASLRAFYPEKYARSRPGLHTVINRGIKAATGYSATGERAPLLFIVLMFIFGHGILTDPLYPWVAATLNDPRVEHPDDRIQRLQRTAEIYLARMLEHLAVNAGEVLQAR